MHRPDRIPLCRDPQRGGAERAIDGGFRGGAQPGLPDPPQRPPEHYAAFLDGLTRRVAEALERYAAEHCPGCGAEPLFFFAAAQSFVGVLRMTMEDCAEREKTLRYLRQVFRFQFAYFEERLGMIEK